MNRYRVCFSALLISATSATSGGCYNAAFVRNDGPVRSGGVAVAVIGQRCDFSPDFNDAPDSTSAVPNQLDLGIRVAVENASGDTITITPGNLRLLIGGDATLPDGAPAPVQVAPGATAKINVRFKHPGDVGCNGSLSLGLANAILAGAKPIELRPVSFVASTTET